MSEPRKSAGSAGPETQGADYALVQDVLQGKVEQRETLGQRLLLISRILRAIKGRHGLHLSNQDLDDLAQNAVLVVWKKLGEFRGPGGLDPWMYRICQYGVMSHCRQRQRESNRLAANGQEKIYDIPSKVSAESSEPLSEDLESALGVLPDEAQEIIRLHNWDGMTFKEIARHQRVHISKVKSKYYRALERIGRSLQDRAKDHAPGKGGKHAAQ